MKRHDTRWATFAHDRLRMARTLRERRIHRRVGPPLKVGFVDEPCGVWPVRALGAALDPLASGLLRSHDETSGPLARGRGSQVPAIHGPDPLSLGQRRLQGLGGKVLGLLGVSDKQAHPEKFMRHALVELVGDLDAGSLQLVGQFETFGCERV